SLPPQRGDSARMGADERLHPLDRRARIGRVGLAGHKAVIGALVELQFDVTARLFPAGDEPLHRLHRYPFVAVAAKDERRRQMHLVAAVEDRRRAALAHRRLVTPERVMIFHKLGIAGLLREVVAQERIEDAPARHDKGDPSVDLRRFGERQSGVIRIVGPHRREQRLMPARRCPETPDPIRAPAGSGLRQSWPLGSSCNRCPTVAAAAGLVCPPPVIPADGFRFAQPILRSGLYCGFAARWRTHGRSDMRRTASSTTAAEVTETADGSSGRSSARLVAALEALTRAEEGMGLAELSLAVGAPKSSLLGILRSLVRLGYLAHAHGLYRLGPRSFRLAADMLAVRRFPSLVRPV